MSTPQTMAIIADKSSKDAYTQINASATMSPYVLKYIVVMIIS